MNEFLEQFLIEARELVDQATSDLLALEDKPDSKERLDSAFRAVHTLKGAAGIVEFEAMGRAMHAVEDVLSSLRETANVVTPELVGNCLTALDRVVQWLDVIQTTGDLPSGADAQADAVVARFVKGADTAITAATPPNISATDWVGDILARHPEAAEAAHTAIRFTPDANCFFRGEDPLAPLATNTSLLALNITGRQAWPAIDEIDPFQCQMIITALLTASPAEAAAAFETVISQVDIFDLRSSASLSGLRPAARSLIEAQIHLLSETAEDGFEGRLASAGHVAAAVMRSDDRTEDAANIEHAKAQSLVTGDPESLIAVLRLILNDKSEDLFDAVKETQTDTRADGPEAVTRVRVDAGRIDKLVKLVGELTVVKNNIAHVAGLAATGHEGLIAAPLKAHALQFERLLSQLQVDVLSLRVLPLRHVFQRFPKLVREIVVGLGKPARFIVEGETTEADKSIIEALFDPLLHVIRNAADHGVETAEERAAQGKSGSATIILRGRRQSENLIIEVSDDGRGVAVERVREAARARGIASAEALAAMSDAGIIDLIFEPGFSTAAHVTDLSGRGVGMDVVRSAINRLGGRVQIESVEGHGTTVRFVLPFSIMMTRIMTVESGNQIFGIPLDFVAETLHLPRDQIVPLGAGHAFTVRDRTVPLLRLSECLGAKAEETPPICNIVLTTMDGDFAGLEVDRIIGQMEVLMQPMEGLLSDMPGVAGTTLLGDGRVLLVLDLEDLLR